MLHRKRCHECHKGGCVCSEAVLRPSFSFSFSLSCEDDLCRARVHAQIARSLSPALTQNRRNLRPNPPRDYPHPHPRHHPLTLSSSSANIIPTTPPLPQSRSSHTPSHPSSYHYQTKHPHLALLEQAASTSAARRVVTHVPSRAARPRDIGRGILSAVPQVNTATRQKPAVRTWGAAADRDGVVQWDVGGRGNAVWKAGR